MPKKPLDANKPRGPVTAYALFVRTCRDELRRKYPQLNVDYNVIAKKCSERWKVMNDNEKKRFNDSVELQRKRYKEEMATYNQEQSIKQQQQSATSSILVQTPATQFLLESPSLQQQQHTLIMSAPAQHAGISSAMKKPTKKRERKPKDPLAPKKPLSAYFLFCADERAKVMGSQSGLSVSDVARELGARWKNISAELKQKYEQSASEKKLAFMAEMTAYNINHRRARLLRPHRKLHRHRTTINRRSPRRRRPFTISILSSNSCSSSSNTSTRSMPMTFRTRQPCSTFSPTRILWTIAMIKLSTNQFTRAIFIFFLSVCNLSRVSSYCSNQVLLRTIHTHVLSPWMVFNVFHSPARRSTNPHTNVMKRMRIPADQARVR